MKKILATILAVIMVFSMVPVASVAAGVETIKQDIVLAENAGKTGIDVSYVAVTGDTNVTGLSYAFTFSTDVFELCDASGAPVSLSATAANIKDKMVEFNVGPFADNFSSVQAISKDGYATVAFVLGTATAAPLAETATLAKTFLKYKTGMSASNVTPKTLRQATYAEAKSCKQNAVVQAIAGTTKYLFVDKDGNTTEGFAANITFGEGFEFNKTLTGITLTYDKTAVDVSKDPVVCTPTVKASYEETSEPEVLTEGVTFEWVTSLSAGVSLADDGKVTVTKDVEASGTATVKATASGVSATCDIVITKADPALTAAEISGPASANIPASGTSTANYSVVAEDQYGASFTGFDKTWTVTAPDGAEAGKVDIAADGTLTVAAGATAGTYTVKVTLSVGGVDKLSKEKSVAVNAMTVTWPTADLTLTYGQNKSEATATATATPGSLSGEVTIDDATLADIPAAGNYDTVAVKFTVTTEGEYKGATATGTMKLTVAKKNIAVKIDDATKVYNDADPAFSWTPVEGALVGTDTKDAITETVTATHTGVNVGAYDITGTVSGTSDNYVITEVQKGTMTITAKSIAAGYEATVADVTYTGAAQTPTVTVAGLTDADFDLEFASNTDAGVATVTVKGKGNYGDSFDKTFNINKAPLTDMVPTISGAVTVGETVTAALEGVAADEVTWNWYYTVGDDATPVSTGVTTATLELTDKYEGSQITVIATALEKNYTGTSASSVAETVSAKSTGTSGRPSSDRTPSSSTSGAGIDKKPTEGEETKPTSVDAFEDVTTNDWYCDTVDRAVKAGIMIGVDNTHFAPNMNTSRAMVATILWRLAGEPTARIKIADYPDVVDHWALEAVRWASEAGIVTGFETGDFGPDQSVTREQMAAMVCRYNAWKTGKDVEEGKVEGFADAESVSDWAQSAMNWAINAGIINGKDGNRLDPLGTATRAEAATILVRMLDNK